MKLVRRFNKRVLNKTRGRGGRADLYKRCGLKWVKEGAKQLHNLCLGTKARRRISDLHLRLWAE